MFSIIEGLKMGSKKLIIASAFILLGFFLLFGCTQQASEQGQTCSQLKGYICTQNQTCFGKVLSSSDSPSCCSVVCSQNGTSTDSNIAKTCSSENGFVCNSDERCDSNYLNVTDSSFCCPKSCTKVVEKSLAEINWQNTDFSSGFVLNDTVSGDQKNALEYADGNQAYAQELLANGWQENNAWSEPLL